jgi:hypothetical protein
VSTLAWVVNPREIEREPVHSMTLSTAASTLRLMARLHVRVALLLAVRD